MRPPDGWSGRFTARLPTVVITPTFNERANVAELVTRFFAAVGDVQLLVVDDSSPDGTADLCERLRGDFENLRVLVRERREGLGRAYAAGIRYALDRGFKVVGTMDADLSHDPAYLPVMLPLADRHDVVVGSRYVRDGGTVNWPIRRIMLSRVANAFAGRLLSVPAHDLTSGFRVYTSEILERIRVDEIASTGYSFLVEMLYRSYRAGARIVEVPIVFHDRTLGASKLGTSEIYKGAYRLLRLRASVRGTRPDRDG